MRLLMRICWLALVTSYGTLELFSDYILNGGKVLGVFLVPVAALSGIVIFFGLISSWWKTRFQNRLWKMFWLIVLIVGSPYMIGPALYYLLVFELGKTAMLQANKGQGKR